MASIPPISFRVSLARPLRNAGDPAAMARAIANPNATIQNAISLGLQKLALAAQRERFTGRGPFPVPEKKLGVVSGRLRRDIHAEPAAMIANGYSARVGARVEYFGAHEVGFSGTVQVGAHKRAAREVRRKKQQRIGRGGKEISVRANRFTLLEQSVRAHSRKVNIPARQPLRTAIEEHSARILGLELRRAIDSFQL